MKICSLCDNSYVCMGFFFFLAETEVMLEYVGITIHFRS